MLSEVRITNNAVFSCCMHALSTEREEVMGLLLGQIRWKSETQPVACVWGTKQLIRVDKRPDRVEISPEALMDAMTAAEELGKTVGMETQVVGWYHSHPKITLLPSHVDLRTQGAYQQMSPAFVGLIFSVYSIDPKGNNKIHIHSFQSSNERNPHPLYDPVGDVGGPCGEPWRRVAVPIRVIARHDIQSLHTTADKPCAPIFNHGIILSETLLAEEKEAIEAAQADVGGNCPLRQTFCTSVYIKNVTRIVNIMAAPYLSDLKYSILPSLRDRCQSLDQTISSLQEEKELLIKQLGVLRTSEQTKPTEPNVHSGTTNNENGSEVVGSAGESVPSKDEPSKGLFTMGSTDSS